jgi:hypothetical protein
MAETTNCRQRRDLPASGWPHEQGARALFEAASEQLIELADAAREHVAGELGLVLARIRAREHLDAAGRDDQVVEAAPEALAAVLDHPHPAALGAVVRAPAPPGGSTRGEAVTVLSLVSW